MTGLFTRLFLLILIAQKLQGKVVINTWGFKEAAASGK